MQELNSLMLLPSCPGITEISMKNLRHKPQQRLHEPRDSGWRRKKKQTSIHLQDTILIKGIFQKEEGLFPTIIPDQRLPYNTRCLRTYKIQIGGYTNYA